MPPPAAHSTKSAAGAAPCTDAGTAASELMRPKLKRRRKLASDTQTDYVPIPASSKKRCAAADDREEAGRRQEKKRRAQGLLTYTALDNSQAGNPWVSVGSEACGRRGVEMEGLEAGKGGAEQNQVGQHTREARASSGDDVVWVPEVRKRCAGSFDVGDEAAAASGWHLKGKGSGEEVGPVGEAHMQQQQQGGKRKWQEQEEGEKQQHQEEQQQQQEQNPRRQLHKHQKVQQQQEEAAAYKPDMQAYVAKQGQGQVARPAGSMAASKADRQPTNCEGAGPLAICTSSSSGEEPAAEDGRATGNMIAAAEYTCRARNKVGCALEDQQQQEGNDGQCEQPQRQGADQQHVRHPKPKAVAEIAHAIVSEVQNSPCSSEKPGEGEKDGGRAEGQGGEEGDGATAAGATMAEAVPTVLTCEIAELDLDPTQGCKDITLKAAAAWKGTWGNEAGRGLLVSASTTRGGPLAAAALARRTASPLAATATAAAELYTAGPVDDLVLEPTQLGVMVGSKALTNYVSGPQQQTASDCAKQQLDQNVGVQGAHEQHHEEQQVKGCKRQHPSASSERLQGHQPNLAQIAQAAAASCVQREEDHQQHEVQQHTNSEVVRVVRVEGRVQAEGHDHAAATAALRSKRLDAIGQRQAAEGALKAAVAAVIACPHEPGISVDTEMAVQSLSLQLLQWVATGHKQHEEQRLQEREPGVLLPNR